jgi:hypothetical protein
MSTDLLRLLAQAHPERSQGDLLAMLEAIPGKPQKTTVQRRVGSRPRTDASMARRRSWAAAGRLPPALASRFTTGEVATLAVIAAQVKKHGACRLMIDAIAAIAGVGRSTVKRALAAAEAAGVIHVERRRLSAFRNDSNVVRIVSREWLVWLKRGPEGTAAQLYLRSNLRPARHTVLDSKATRPWNRSQGLPKGRVRGGRSPGRDSCSGKERHE